MTSAKPHTALRAIALLKAAKSLLALVAGLWLCSMVGRDVQAMTATLASHLHLDPDWPLTQYLLTKTAGIKDANLWFFVVTLFAYTLVHGAEAYGLWHEYLWAEWFTLCSGLIYLPLELHSMAHGITRVNTGLLLLSLAITGYIGWVLYHSRKRRREAGKAGGS